MNPYERAERNGMVAETFSDRSGGTDEYYCWLNIRREQHDKAFCTISEEGYIEFHDLPFVETGTDELGCPEGFEGVPMISSDDLLWIAALADEFSERDKECLLKSIPSKK